MIERKNGDSPKSVTGDSPDFICVTGDAYVDHPSFGIAIIKRLLESLGFSVGVISQPVSDSDFMSQGKPTHGFMVTGGNIDSMVANYTVNGKKRLKDAYSLHGKGGKRPDRALIVYCQKLKSLFPDSDIVIGGLEASLRRFAHYDFWSDSVMPSILTDTRADLLVYGMGELVIKEICQNIRAGKRISELKTLRGTCVISEPRDTPHNAVQCDSFEICRDNKKAYAKSCRKQYDEQDYVYGRTVLQRHGNKMLIQNPPSRPLNPQEFDEIYELDFTREAKDIPAIQEVEFSITHNRGCFGFCNFCSIALHQGRRIQARSKDSIIREATFLTQKKGFKGYLHDIGGPTANFRKPSCEMQLTRGLCKGKKCHSCEKLEVEHSEYLEILRELRRLPRVKKVFIRSGIRYDYLLKDKSRDFLNELAEHHVSGQLKIAPEHSVSGVLDCMGKPHIDSFLEFKRLFYAKCAELKKEQYLVPYLMSSHPGSTLKDAVELAVFLKENDIRPEQVQDFYPTPGTISTAMYYTGLCPYTLKEIYVAREPHERKMQRALLQYYKSENADLVRKALIKTGLVKYSHRLLGKDLNNGAKKEKKRKSR
ncbi:MAG: YgiQ family radical SAM protein [Oscillospiraceae bacterium]|nr:YgiQ family radical SAM protein [Oscillospiraceae bacterium]